MRFMDLSSGGKLTIMLLSGSNRLRALPKNLPTQSTQITKWQWTTYSTRAKA
jgi:hypothetical protein